MLLKSHAGIGEPIARQLRFVACGDGAIGKAANSRATFATALENSKDAANLALRQYGMRACISLPLLIEDRLIGTLAFATKSKTAFTPGEIDFLQLISGYLAIAIEHVAMADPARLQQVFWNLLRNAIKFTPAGGKVTIYTANPSPGTLVFEVSDSGKGISSEDLERIFLPFEQADATGDHRFGGLGMGLAISKAIAELHNGKLEAQSAGLEKARPLPLPSQR